MVTTLNACQLLFAQHVIAGMSLTAAYREAGYTGEGHVAHAGASKLMAKPAIAAFIDSHQQQATQNAIADRREIISRLTRVLRSEASDFEAGHLPVHEISRRTIVKSDGTRVTRTRTKSMSRHAALRQLARIFKLQPAPDLSPTEQRDIDSARSTMDPAIAAGPVLSALAAKDGELIQIGRNLNSRQRLFCEYLARDVPPASAYHYAGYGHEDFEADPSPAISRLLKRPAVALYLHELRHHAITGDPAGDLATREEILSYLTQALRAEPAEIEQQGRFIDQVIQDEIEKPDGETESRTLIRSISQPRIIAQLLQLLDPGDDSPPDDQYTRLILADWKAVFAAAADDFQKSFPPMS